MQFRETFEVKLPVDKRYSFLIHVSDGTPFYLSFVYVFRYMTALTDSDDELPSDVEQQDEERPPDALSILLERIDRLHRGSESDKKESVEILLQHREEVCIH